MSRDATFRMIDIHLGLFLAERSSLTGEERDRFRGLVQELSLALEDGHSCLLLEPADRLLFEKSPLVSVGGETPLVIVNDRLYLHRYYTYESRLANQLLAFARSEQISRNMKEALDRCFGIDREEIDWQKKAAETALTKSLCLISGGPGTGKTSTVARILGLLLELFDSSLRIALAAPTGKAAMRLQESINRSIGALPFDGEIIRHIPTEASTLHRLLGVIRSSPRFRHNRENPLPLDVLIIDEASMVDLAMMSKVVDALRPGSRLILLGDKDQLASVESGAVLTDCIRGLPDNTVELKKSYRFEEGIKALAETVNRGDSTAAWSVLMSEEYGNASLLQESYTSYAGEKYCRFMDTVKQYPGEGLSELFGDFFRFQVLCATRRGPRGVAAVNGSVEAYLKIVGYTVSPGGWYAGRPVIITRNDYNLGLFNGDIGLCLVDQDQVLKVWFETADGQFKKFLPYRLPACETVYAMTIHKSQGSEFAEVLVMAPDDENRLLNRQLIYTAVTRAKEKVVLSASRKVLEFALSQDYPRHSGLWQMLQNQ